MYSSALIVLSPLSSCKMLHSVPRFHPMHVDASAMRSSLSVVEVEERPPLGVQSRGIAASRNQTRLEGRTVVCVRVQTRSVSRLCMCAHARSQMERAIRTPIVAYFPSPTVIGYVNNTLACSPPLRTCTRPLPSGAELSSTQLKGGRRRTGRG